MYTCPECGSHDVTVKRMAPVVESWHGEDCTREFDEDGAAADEGALECDECGAEVEGDLYECWE